MKLSSNDKRISCSLGNGLQFLSGVTKTKLEKIKIHKWLEKSFYRKKNKHRIDGQ